MFIELIRSRGFRKLEGTGLTPLRVYSGILEGTGLTPLRIYIGVCQWFGSCETPTSENDKPHTGNHAFFCFPTVK